jgi:signal peptidase II
MLFYLIALLIIGCDQFLKFLVVSKMALGVPVEVIDHVLQLTYVRNTGAAFSLFIGFSSYLVVVGLVVVLLVLYFHYRLPQKSLLLQIGMAFILGGSIGNLTDRVIHGYVIDYIDFIVWPVFNLADIMINLGVGLIAQQIFTQKDVSNTI